MMPLDQAEAVLWTQRILGGGLLLQSVELFMARGIYSPSGALNGRVSVNPLLAVRGAISIWLFVAPVNVNASLSALLFAVLLVSTAWLVIRSRGPVCGGSDSMFFQVQLGLFLAALGFVHPVLPSLGLGWIAAQSVLSYFLAGVGKLRNSAWRDGSALRRLFTSNGPYVLWQGVRGLAQAKFLCVLLGFGIVLFELVFPLVLFMPTEWRYAFLGLALGFHAANALVLGLNRFIWAWAATYPALLFFHPR
ncbi:MAG: hypothetical protein QM813_14325 [Verrucomicrobiota bacterium]